MKIIAETAAHHEGDFEFMVDLVSKIADSSADVAKIHVGLDLDEYMTPDHPVYKLAKNWLFSTQQWDEIVDRVRSGGKELMMLTNDIKAVEYAKLKKPSLLEIHSVALNDVNLLAAAREAILDGTRLVLGVGGSTLEEIDNAMTIVGEGNIVLMFGFQNYPTRYSDINFGKIRRVMSLYPNHEFGYADHTGWDEPNNMLVTMMGASLGMSYVEKHVSHVPGQKRVDAAAVVDFDYIRTLAKNLAVLKECEGSGSLLLNEAEQKYCVFGSMKKAAVIVESLSAGELLSIDHIAFKRTGTESDLSQLNVLQLMGRKSKNDLKAGHVLRRADLE